MAAWYDGGWELSPGFQEVEESDTPETSLEGPDEALSKELDEVYQGYLEEAEKDVESIRCRNQALEGLTHPETGVTFQRREIEVDGKRLEVVVPEFESKFEAQLPPELYKASYGEQFRACDMQLQEAVAKYPELRDRFDLIQLEQIEDGEMPDGYTWHHDAEEGRMQLVDTEIHQKTAHTGGRSFWGGE